MGTPTISDFRSAADDRVDTNELVDRSCRESELPSPGRWWTKRKAGVIEAARCGSISIDELTRRYSLSIDDFVAWERELNRYGIPGLRTTRFQIDRGTASVRRVRGPSAASRVLSRTTAPATQMGAELARALARPMAATDEQAVPAVWRIREPKARSEEAYKSNSI